jgi:hypothetical protein
VCRVGSSNKDSEILDCAGTHICWGTRESLYLVCEGYKLRRCTTQLEGVTQELIILGIMQGHISMFIFKLMDLCFGHNVFKTEPGCYWWLRQVFWDSV